MKEKKIGAALSLDLQTTVMKSYVKREHKTRVRDIQGSLTITGERQSKELDNHLGQKQEWGCSRHMTYILAKQAMVTMKCESNL